jgi:hypothetical protein
MSYKSTLSYLTSSKDPEGTTTLATKFELWDETPPQRRADVRRRLGDQYTNSQELDEFLKSLNYVQKTPNNCVRGNEKHYFRDFPNGGSKKTVFLKVFSPTYNSFFKSNLSLMLNASYPGRIEEAEILDVLKFKDFLLYGGGKK